MVDRVGVPLDEVYLLVRSVDRATGQVTTLYPRSRGGAGRGPSGRAPRVQSWLEVVWDTCSGPVLSWATAGWGAWGPSGQWQGGLIVGRERRAAAPAGASAVAGGGSSDLLLLWAALGGCTLHLPLLAGARCRAMLLVWGVPEAALRKGLLRKVFCVKTCRACVSQSSSWMHLTKWHTWLSPLSHYPEATLRAGLTTAHFELGASGPCWAPALRGGELLLWEHVAPRAHLLSGRGGLF